MINKFTKYPLWEINKELVDVAMGRLDADLVIKNCNLINVCTREIINNIDVCVYKGRIAKVGQGDDCIGKNTKIINATGLYLCPAFMDGHMHIESSMLKPSEYAKAVIPHGTSAIFYDPHEICNVLGLEGVKCMIEDSKTTPLKCMLTIPSCVPAVPGFEDTGSSIGPKDIEEAMKWDEVVALGELMNFPGILYGNPETFAIANETLKADKLVTGHYSVPEIGKGLNAYIASGVRCCHESVREIDALTKMRLGMYAQIRESSAWRDLQELSKALTKHEVDSRFACLVTDDNHPNTLSNLGHLDYIVRRAIEEGISVLEAYQMVTINVAQCFQLDHELGSITPGKCADMVLISDLNKVDVVSTIIDGELVFSNGKTLFESKEYNFPKWAIESIHLNNVCDKDFIINSDKDKVKARVIEIISGKTITKEVIEELDVVNNSVVANGEKDILKACVLDRHHINGSHSFGFVKGFGIKEGALAQTVAHDAHNMLVIGSNDQDMAIAVNELIKCGGGLIAIKNGKILGKVELPIAGLISNKPLKETNQMVDSIEKAWKDMGCTCPSPFMTMGILSLACIPSLRLTNRGLVDCDKFEFVDLFIE